VTDEPLAETPKSDDRRWALRYSVYRWVRYELAKDDDGGWRVVGFVTGRLDTPMTPQWFHPRDLARMGLDTLVGN
jgi:hypothetical protein